MSGRYQRQNLLGIRLYHDPASHKIYKEDKTVSSFDLKTYLQSQREKVEAALERLIPVADDPSAKVMEAMRYSIMAGGKRVRPILLLAAADAVGGNADTLLPAACALECLHTYSLIHDDLPAMDDDDLRRGRPTCHKVYGEAIAILAGDGLLNYSFELLSSPELRQAVEPDRLLDTIATFGRAAGVFGMVGGQTADILNEGKPIDAETLSFIHTHKTGALLAVSVEMGAILGRGSEKEINAMKEFGQALGLTFQIVDDILDIVGDEKVIGKPVGSDTKNQKATYPALFGLDAARTKAEELLAQALDSIAGFDSRAEPLRAIARYVVERNR